MNSPIHEQHKHYLVVERAIEYIRAHARQQPSLAQIAAAMNLSEYHLQRVFSAWAGLSPKRFLQYLTKEHARQALLQSKDILSTTLETGLSSPGRLHDLMVTCDAMSPGEIRQHGVGVELHYGRAKTPFGEALIGTTTRGICYLAFCDDDGSRQQQELAAAWPAAELVRDHQQAQALANTLFDFNPGAGKLHLLLCGTNFQIKVWEALLRIQPSQLISYTTLAGLSHSPGAHRAVATAVAANPVAFLIPCHRVIRGNGETGQYHWGSNRKAAMQTWEAAVFDKD